MRALSCNNGNSISEDFKTVSAGCPCFYPTKGLTPRKVFSEKPFASAITNGSLWFTRCQNCLKETKGSKLIGCSTCNKMSYCSEDCKNNFDEIHKLAECKVTTDTVNFFL